MSNHLETTEHYIDPHPPRRDDPVTSSCYIDAPHGPHEWFPTIADPDYPRVIHVGALSARCPGRDTTHTEPVAGETRGLCPVCHRVVHRRRDGALQEHGPRADRCAGSGHKEIR